VPAGTPGRHLIIEKEIVSGHFYQRETAGFPSKSGVVSAASETDDLTQDTIHQVCFFESLRVGDISRLEWVTFDTSVHLFHPQ
jgi:hypothetical protein